MIDVLTSLIVAIILQCMCVSMSLSILSLCSVICQSYLNEVGESFYQSITYIQKSAYIISIQIWLVFTNWTVMSQTPRARCRGLLAPPRDSLKPLSISSKILDNANGCTNVISTQLCTHLGMRSHNCTKIAPKCVESDFAWSHRWILKRQNTLNCVNCHLEGKRGLPCGSEE